MSGYIVTSHQEGVYSPGRGTLHPIEIILFIHNESHIVQIIFF